jgi:hypothetical protein
MVTGYSTNRYGSSPVVSNVPVTDRPYASRPVLSGLDRNLLGRPPAVVAVDGPFELVQPVDGQLLGRVQRSRRGFRS